MKTKLLSLLVIITFCSALQAQDEGGTTFGIRAGINFQNINGKNDVGDQLENDLVARYHAGLNVEIPIATDFYIQPGVMFVTKGSKYNDQIGELNVSSTSNLSYIEIPVNFIYKPLLGTGHMLLGFGPYVGFGIGGKVRSGDNEFDVDFKNSASPSDLFVVRRLDSGANFLVGYEFANMLSMQLNAQLGLVDINPDYGVNDDKTHNKHTGLGLSLGYRF